MKYSLNMLSNLLLFLLVIVSAGCTRVAYERMEESSLPRYQQGVPVISKFEKVCRVRSAHEIGGFLLSFDSLWDVTTYPTNPTSPPRWEPKSCGIDGIVNGRFVDLKYTEPQPLGTYYRNDEAIKFSECISYSAPNVCSKLGERKPNTDPNKGALKAWGIASIPMDGLNWKSLMVHFDAVVVEGDKMPLGTTGTFNNYKRDEVIIEKLTIHNRAWEHLQGIPTLDSFGRLSGAPDLYKTKINNYTLFIRGSYSHQIINQPYWLAKRRAFLREWVETFKIEPLPADYKKIQ